MITVATYTHSDEAHLARSRLEGAGVEVEMSEDLIASVLPLHTNAIGGIKLRVPDDQVAFAREVLELPPVTEQGITRCPHCGSTNIDHRRLPFPVVLTMVAFGFLFPFFDKRMRCLDCEANLALSEVRNRQAK